MPTRLLREGITSSEPVAALSFAAECLFYRLIVTVDDFGLCDGRPVMVRAKCMPLRDVSLAEIDEWLTELATHDLIVRYESEGKPFIGIRKFKQRTRASASKCPLPSDDWLASDGHVPVNCQTPAAEYVFGDVFGDGDEEGARGHPSGVTPEAWGDFVAHRRAKRARLTDRAVALIVRQLTDMRSRGLDPNEALRASVANGWTGVFDPKPKPPARAGPAAGVGKVATAVLELEAMKHADPSGSVVPERGSGRNPAPALPGPRRSAG